MIALFTKIMILGAALPSYKNTVSTVLWMLSSITIAYYLFIGLFAWKYIIIFFTQIFLIFISKGLIYFLEYINNYEILIIFNFFLIFFLSYTVVYNDYQLSKNIFINCLQKFIIFYIYLFLLVTIIKSINLHMGLNINLLTSIYASEGDDIPKTVGVNLSGLYNTSKDTVSVSVTVPTEVAKEALSKVIKDASENTFIIGLGGIAGSSTAKVLKNVPASPVVKVGVTTLIGVSTAVLGKAVTKTLNPSSNPNRTLPRNPSTTSTDSSVNSNIPTNLDDSFVKSVIESTDYNPLVDLLNYMFVIQILILIYSLFIGWILFCRFILNTESFKKVILFLIPNSYKDNWTHKINNLIEIIKSLNTFNTILFISILTFFYFICLFISIYLHLNLIQHLDYAVEIYNSNK